VNTSGAIAFLAGTIIPLAIIAFVLIGLWGRDPDRRD